MMLTHEDFDDLRNKIINENIKLPEKIKSISFSHDGGRIFIYINGEEFYKSYSGTRDCNITIDNA